MVVGCMVVRPPEEESGEKPAQAEGEANAEARPARPTETTDETLVAGGEKTYQSNCASCHGSGMAGAPDLTGVTERMDRRTFLRTLDEGPGTMPSWSHLSGETKKGLWAFLDSPAAKEGGAVAQTESAGGGCGGGCGGGGGCGCGQNAGGCGCGGGKGGGGCGTVDREEPEPKPTEPTKPAKKAGGCGCGR